MVPKHWYRERNWKCLLSDVHLMWSSGGYCVALSEKFPQGGTHLKFQGGPTLPCGALGGGGAESEHFRGKGVSNTLSYFLHSDSSHSELPRTVKHKPGMGEKNVGLIARGREESNGGH